MKLLACIDCGDIFNLTSKEKSCSCGKTKGRYINDIDAEYEGNAQPIGFSNPSFRTSLIIQRQEDKMPKPKNECCKGVEFTAFFIPKAATTLTKID
jgi:predicted  nucleic acid-binding Zn-ribbon protein